MKAIVMRYLNEIVSLTVLGLMAVALIAGQAEATVNNVVRKASELSDPAQISVEAVLEIRFDRKE